MNSVPVDPTLRPGSQVQPIHGMDVWKGTVIRIEDGKALLDITELWLHRDLWRRLTPPVRAWVSVDGVEERDLG